MPIKPHLLALFATGAVTVPGRAQNFDLPPTNIITNYNRVNIGQREALEGGAFVARTNDAGANWYNPAGLAQAERAAINAGGHAWEVITVAVEGFGTRRGGARFKTIGTFFGVVLGEPWLGGRTVRLGFSIAKPVAWEPGAVDGAVEHEVTGGQEEISLFGQASLSTVVPAVSAGFRVSDRLRVGLGVRIPATNLSQTGIVSDRLLVPTAGAVLTRSVVIDGSSWAVEGTAGVQWEVSPGVRLGAHLVTPSGRLSGSGRVTSEQTFVSQPLSRETSFRDPEMRFDYRFPARATLGAAFRLGKGVVEVDLRLTASADEYALLESDLTAREIEITPGGTTVTEAPFAPVVESTRATTNLAIGGHYPISGSFTAHAGYFTDQSPVGDPATSLFRAMELSGLSAGASVGGRLSGSFGFTTTWGTTESRSIGPSLGGVTTNTTLDVRIFSTLFALSYRF